MTSFAWGVATDVGRVRHINQDSLVARLGLFAVADGMGGHTGGEIAAEIAVEVLEAHRTIVSTQDLIDAVHAMNAAIMARAEAEPSLTGMGTTLCALALVVSGDQERLALANVGDSRVYVYAGDELQQLTEDHSLVAQLVRDGTLTATEAERHPQRNVLTRALGIDHDVSVDAWEVLPFTGDRFVLCSDGLSNELTDDQIAAVLRRLADPQEAANELVRLANDNGGRDNITVVVVDIIGDVRADGGSPSIVKQRVPDLAGFETAVADQDGDRPFVADLPAEPAAHASREVREPRPPIFTVRMIFFLFACVLVLLVALGAVVWIGRRTYYVAFDDANQVVIYRGRPGGVLWIDPTEAEVTDLTRDQIPQALIPTLEKGHDVSSLGDARRYVDNVRAEIARVQATGAGSTTTSSTTTLAADRGCAVRDLGSSNFAMMRRVELGLVVMAALIIVAAYVLVSMGSDASVPANIGPFFGAVVALMIGAHIATRRLAPNADPLLLPLAVLLNGLGYVFIVRVANDVKGARDLPGLQANWTMLGVMAYVATLFVLRRVRVLDRYRYIFMAIGVGLLLMPLTPGLGRTVSGARIWIRFAGLSFQPGEIAKIALAIFFASYLVEHRELLRIGSFKVGPLHLPEPKHLGPLALAWGVSLIVLVMEKDLGSSLLFFAVFVTMVWIATERSAYLLIGLLLFSGGVRQLPEVRSRADPRRGMARPVARPQEQGLPDHRRPVRDGRRRADRYGARPGSPVQGAEGRDRLHLRRDR